MPTKTTTPKTARQLRRHFADVWQTILRDPVYGPLIERQARKWEADRDNIRKHGARPTRRSGFTVIDGDAS